MSRSRLSLSPTLPPSAALNEAFARILAYAAKQPHQADRAKAVHEFRKSLRRGRALVRLLRRLLGETRMRRLDQELRAITLPTSVLRDADALLAGIDSLLPPEAGPTLSGLRHQLRERQQANLLLVDGVLATAVERLHLLPGRFARTIPGEISEEDLIQALRFSYRRARRKRRQAEKHPTHESIHDFRKRVKEVRYQVELLARAEAGHTALSELSQFAKQLGRVTDQMVLQGHLEAVPGSEAWGFYLEERLTQESRQAIADSREFFQRKSRDFARTVLSRTPPAVAAKPISPPCPSAQSSLSPDGSSPGPLSGH